MNEATQRLGTKLIQGIPAPLRTLVARIRPLARYRAASKYRRIYDGRFVSKIDPEDDLLHYSIDFASESYSASYYHGTRMYFEGGEWNVAEVAAVLGDLGVSVSEVDSLLEFACGYGRLTRHFVQRISPSRITVSDIDHRAVDFVTREFGVRGFYSASTPEEMTHDDRYDVIVVVSLFSHLPRQSWGPWLKRLTEMLKANGMLLFSTLPLDTGGAEVNDVDKEAVEAGFLYKEKNETRGRLTSEHYGTATVNEEFVRRAVSENSAGRLIKYAPRVLNGVQDAYVLQRVSEADTSRAPKLQGKPDRLDGRGWVEVH